MIAAHSEIVSAIDVQASNRVIAFSPESTHPLALINSMLNITFPGYRDRAQSANADSISSSYGTSYNSMLVRGGQTDSGFDTCCSTMSNSSRDSGPIFMIRSVFGTRSSSAETSKADARLTMAARSTRLHSSRSNGGSPNVLAGS
ncbi:hypothetical protein A0H81_14527 [Grifola frondosa]|uniref:Uncharacterized protein n=1 Tax=Grifola frondosa TaxID=5627 RepID=A0A1C7LMG8_GRIFR|nr:hypothetical protein A0H81_14527 [Grifola frondosa]